MFYHSSSFISRQLQQELEQKDLTIEYNSSQNKFNRNSAINIIKRLSNCINKITSAENSAKNHIQHFSTKSSIRISIKDKDEAIKDLETKYESALLQLKELQQNKLHYLLLFKKIDLDGFASTDKPIESLTEMPSIA